MSFPEVFTWIFDIWLSAIKYTIEIHDSSDNLVCVLENAHDISYKEAINEAPTLKFSLPADDDKADNIVKANEIWLRNYEVESPTVVNRFRLSQRSDGRERNGKLTTLVEADGLINQLADEQLVTLYAPGSKTCNQHITALLALQVFSAVITEGTIAPTSSRTITANIGDTILRTIYRLRDTVGGYVSVDNDRALQWANSIGEDTGQQIRYQKNLVGITRKTDYTTIGNRIYAYGAGEGDARIKLSDVQANDYVEDATSQTDWGGIYVKILVNRSITDADALLAWALLQLAELKDPIITYKIDTTDLAESVEAGFGFEPIQLGSTVTVIDEELSIDVEVQVVRLVHPDLLHPELVQIELSNRSRDILDVISEVQEVQKEELLSPPTDNIGLEFIIDGGGAAIITGVAGNIKCPFAGIIVSASLSAEKESGDIVVDIWKGTAAIPTVADTITASAKPTLSSAQISEDTTLTGWTVAFAEGDYLVFNVDSAATITRITVTLVVRRT